MQLTDQDLILITGATGLVGSHVAQKARELGIPTRALVRSGSPTKLLESWNVELCEGDLSDPESLQRAADGATIVVHCAAMVGDWGPTEVYRKVNVEGLQALLAAMEQAGSVRRYVHISSLGVYEARDHHGTDETETPSTQGIDGYTLTKVESEQLAAERIGADKLPGVILRPGFIYGPRDRTVLPRIFEKLHSGQFAYLGSPEKLMNNTYVGNLVEAIFLAIERDDAVGEIFNIRDQRLVSKQEFIDTIAQAGGYRAPTKVVPLGVARCLAAILERLWKLLGKSEAPILSSARIKFLGLNLDYSIQKAQEKLGYTGAIDYADAMPNTVDWFRTEGQLPE